MGVFACLPRTDNRGSYAASAALGAFLFSYPKHTDMNGCVTIEWRSDPDHERAACHFDGTITLYTRGSIHVDMRARRRQAAILTLRRLYEREGDWPDWLRAACKKAGKK